MLSKDIVSSRTSAYIGKTARSDRDKRIFLQMAETWLKAAVLADRREQREATASKQQSSGNSAVA